MHIIRGIAVAFSTYSKIPMPQFVWKEEDMRYSMCFFPWIGAVIAAVLMGWFHLSALAGSNSACHHRRISCGRIYGYNGCIAFLSAAGA